MTQTLSHMHAEREREREREREKKKKKKKRKSKISTVPTNHLKILHLFVTKMIVMSVTPGKTFSIDAISLIDLYAPKPEAYFKCSYCLKVGRTLRNILFSRIMSDVSLNDMNMKLLNKLYILRGRERESERQRQRQTDTQTETKTRMTNAESFLKKKRYLPRRKSTEIALTKGTHLVEKMQKISQKQAMYV